MWMPSGSVSPVTRPNSVSTPTLPVGIDVVLHSKINMTKTTAASRKIREPAKRKLGIDGIEPPMSIPPPRVTFTIFPCLHRAASANCCRAHRLYHLLRTVAFYLSRRHGHRICQRTLATVPQHIVVFSLDSRTRKRQNPRQQPSVREFGSRATRPATHEARRPLRGKRYAVSARLHRPMHQSAMRSARSLAARRCHPRLLRRRTLPLLRQFATQRSAAARPAIPHAPAPANRASTIAPSATLTPHTPGVFAKECVTD